MPVVSLEEMFADVGVRARVSAVLDAPRGIVVVNGGDRSGKSSSLFSLAEVLRERGRDVSLVVDDRAMHAYLIGNSRFTDWDTRFVDGKDPEAWEAAIAAAAPRGVVLVSELNHLSAPFVLAAARDGAVILTQASTPYIGIDTAFSLAMMGVSNDDWLQWFSVVASQILVPQLCPHCRQQVTLDLEEARQIDPSATRPVAVWKVTGCARCDQRGTAGWRALHEVVFIDDSSRRVLAARLEDPDAPMPPGHVTMLESARQVLLDGRLGLNTYRDHFSRNPIIRLMSRNRLASRLVPGAAPAPRERVPEGAARPPPQRGPDWPAEGAAPLRWIQCAVGPTTRLIDVKDVLFFRSDEKYTRVQTRQQEALIRTPIRELVMQLDGQQFWQIHRSTIVNVGEIAAVTRDESGRQQVQVRDHPEVLEVSRAYAHLFRAA